MQPARLQLEPLARHSQHPLWYEITHRHSWDLSSCKTQRSSGCSGSKTCTSHNALVSEQAGGGQARTVHRHVRVSNCDSTRRAATSCTQPKLSMTALALTGRS
jgi:hypothetical protein